MNRWMVLALAVIVSGTPLARAGERVFEIDPVHSCLTFRIRHFYTTFTGRFNAFSGTLRGNPDQPTSLKVSAAVDVLSIDTANGARDKHLKSPDFFNTAAFPTARFESTKAEVLQGNAGRVVGNLTLCGVTREVTFTGEFLGAGPDPRGTQKAGFHATAKIDRTAFGMGFDMKMPDGRSALGTEVEIILDLELNEKAPDTPAPVPAPTPAK